MLARPTPRPFLREIKHDAAAEILEPPHGELKLVTAIAAPRTKHVAGEACRVQSHRHGVRKIGLAYDDRGGIAANRVAEHDEARLRAGIEGHRSLARQRQRTDRLAGKSFDRFRIDCDDIRLRRQGIGGNLYRQHRRQTLRQLHELNCCCSGRTGRFCFGNTIASRITDERLDRGRIVLG